MVVQMASRSLIEADSEHARLVVLSSHGIVGPIPEKQSDSLVQSATTQNGASVTTALNVIDRHSRESSGPQAAAPDVVTQEAANLPEQNREKQTMPSPLPAKPGDATGVLVGKLLIVDDDDAVRSFISIATQRLGYQVMGATDGVDALKKLENNPDQIGLILTDVNMPQMDGLELVKALKKRPTSPAIAVMSGRLDPTVRVALQAEGVTAFLNKPFSTEALKTTLLQAVAAR